MANLKGSDPAGDPCGVAATPHLANAKESEKSPIEAEEGTSAHHDHCNH